MKTPHVFGALFACGLGLAACSQEIATPEPGASNSTAETPASAEASTAVADVETSSQPVDVDPPSEIADVATSVADAVEAPEVAAAAVESATETVDAASQTVETSVAEAASAAEDGVADGASVVAEAASTVEQGADEAVDVASAAAASVASDVEEVTSAAAADVETVVAEAVELVEPAPVPAGPVTLASGAWTKKTQNSRGAWSIVEENGEISIRLDDDFSTRGAPDLKLFLSPLSVGDVRNGNAVDGSLFIAELSSNKGAQSYTLPAGVDLADYKSVLIHCQQFTKLWSAGAL